MIEVKIFIFCLLFNIYFCINVQSVEPKVIRVDSKSSDYFTITLNLDNQIVSRNETSIILRSSYCNNITINAAKTQGETELNKISYIYPYNQMNCYAIYNVSFLNKADETPTEFKIYIYGAVMKLAKPKDRYFLVNNATNQITTFYEFVEAQSPEAINQISCYTSSDPENKINILHYNISAKRLEIKFNSSPTFIKYICDIYPRYSTNSIKDDQQFNIHFQDYLLENEAVYLERGTSNFVQFNLTFKEPYNDTKSLSIRKDDERIGEMIDFNKSCENNKCEIYFFTGSYNNPGKYIIFYDITQERELFYILYSKKYSEQCYNKTTDELISIHFFWHIDMEYTHNLYLNDTSYKQIHYFVLNKESSYVEANYSITTSSLNIGLFSLKSSIPALNYTDYNPVDQTKLFISIISDIAVTSTDKIILYKNNQSDQILNMSFSEADTVGVLDEITVKKKDNMFTFTLSKSNGECDNEGSTNFYCNLTEYIKNKEKREILGEYNIYYSDKCKKEANITNLNIEIRQTYNLISLSPKWINESEVNGTNLTLEFDDNVNNTIQFIEISNSLNETIFNFSCNDKNRVDINNNIIIININDSLNHGIYYIKLVTDIDIDYHQNKRFKISNENITFEFSHHYFVLINGGSNKLKITAKINSDDFGYKLLSSNNIEINNSTVQGDIYEFIFNNTGRINFSYFDRDGFLIPIKDNITIVEIYTNIFTFNSWSNCYYFNFDLSIDINNIYLGVNLIVFLQDINNNTIELNKTNNKFSNNESNLINNEYYLFVSDTKLDYEVYLFKSDIINITNIIVPLYIMRPNLFVYFSNVSCDLSKHKFQMIQTGTNTNKKLERCNYNRDKQVLSCFISGNFYVGNLFGEYTHQINDKDIFNTNNIRQTTFASNRLNDSQFSLDINKKVLNYYIYIQNINHDFYFPLIDHLINSKAKFEEDKKTINLTRNSNNIKINDNDKKIEFNISLELNDVYTIGNLTRKSEIDETFDESFYHNFNHIINNTLFTISPKIYAYNKIKQEQEYNIFISYNTEADLNSFNLTSNLKECQVQMNGYIRNCRLNITNDNFIEGKPNNFTITIGNEINKTNETIKFIYYELSEESKICKTKTIDMPDILLNVYLPDNTFTNDLSLLTSLVQTPRDTNKTYIQFGLNGEQDKILESHLELYINNADFYHSFSLIDIGLEVLPMYFLVLNDNKKDVFLFPVNNQKVMVTINAGNYSSIDMGDIQEFYIIAENKDYSMGKEKIDSTKLYIIFNALNIKEGNYSLFYKDKCNNSVETDLNVIIKDYIIDRHYFVLNNNYNREGQKMSLSLGHTIEMNVSIYKDDVKVNTMKYDNTLNKYIYIFESGSKGDYIFEVVYNGFRAFLDDTVYVRDEYTDFLKLEEQPPSCIYNNGTEISSFNIKYSIRSNEFVTNISIFNSFWNANSSRIKFDSSLKNNLNYFNLSLNSNISKNQTYFIFLVEYEDFLQPIFVFTYEYTNISLSDNYKNVIYTDTSLIEFKMKCKLNDNLVFSLVGQNSIINFTCDKDYSTFDTSGKIYQCKVSTSNPLRNYRGESGLFNLSYIEKLLQDNIFISHSIKNINFEASVPQAIMPNRQLVVFINLRNNTFYLPNLDNVIYREKEDPLNLKNATINRNSFSQDFHSFNCSFYLVKGIYYEFFKICRKKCYPINCFDEDCIEIKSPDIISNIPEAYFEFSKHYINLNSGNDNSLNIIIRGDADLIDKIYYYHYNDSYNFKTGEMRRLDSYNYQKDNLEKGKYTFVYLPHTYNENISISNDMVFVTNTYDELLTFNDDSNGCLFYKKTENKGILASITINENYIFKNDIPISDFDIYLDDIRFPYTKNVGYQIVQEYENDFSYNGHNYTLFIVEKNVNKKTYFFAKLESKKVTSFDINIAESFFYKDNIVLSHIYCDIKNFHIQPRKNLNEEYSPLKCIYYKNDNKSFCDAENYVFYNKFSDEFELFIKHQLDIAYDIEQSILLYNSISSANFTIKYYFPNLTLFSDNFAMNNTWKIEIDDEIIWRTNFSSISINNTILEYHKRNDSDYYYTIKIYRLPHDYDRNEEPKTIIMKKLNNTLIDTYCEQFRIYTDGECLTCRDIARRRIEQNKNIWFQDGKCVEKCESPYAIYDSINSFCAVCDGETESNGLSYCRCILGTVKLEINNMCYLPDDPQILDYILIYPNMQCYRIDGKTHNYCSNDNTERCDVKSISGHDYPECVCKEGFYGKYCELNYSSPPDIEADNLDPILNEISDDQINVNSTKTLAKIRAIIYILESNNNYLYTHNISNQKIDNYIDGTIEVIKNINIYSVTFQIYDVLELGIFFLNYYIKSGIQNEKYYDNLNYVLNNVHHINYLTNKETSNFNINSDGLNLITFLSYRKDAIDNSFKNYIKRENEISNLVGYIDLNNNYISNQELIILTIINKNLLDTSNKKGNGRNLEETIADDGITMYYSSRNNKTDLSIINNFFVYIHSSNLNINYDLANYYQQLGIGIYDINDNCFNDPCYFNKKMDYDLTQKYRKKYLFQKVQFNNPNCKYSSFDIETNNIEFFCTKFDEIKTTNDNNDDIMYGTLSFTIQRKRLENENDYYRLLPIKCTNKIDTLNENIAIRVFFVILSLEIIYIIFINVLSLGGSLRNLSIQNGLKNDEIVIIYVPGYVNSESKMINKEHIEVNFHNNKKCIEYLWDNFKELHPLFSLTRVSIIQPLILQSWFVVFNSLGIFGFNALFYWESFIEERIYQPYRDSFAYPMRKEFGKIILSIFCQMILCFLIKVIVLVPKELVSGIRDFAKNSEKVPDVFRKIKYFEKDMILRRLIGGFLMLIIIVFFFYYSVVFCGIYIKTQYCWLYSSLWSLLWIYLVFAPIYIIIISIMDNKKNNNNNDSEEKRNKKYEKNYYIKRLFMF